MVFILTCYEKSTIDCPIGLTITMYIFMLKKTETKSSLRTDEKRSPGCQRSRGVDETISRNGNFFKLR
jgi:hypothetical protein